VASACHDLGVPDAGPVGRSARPQVIAHRGASDAEPEHTLAAYRRAIEMGADALECDVRLTADGHLVCVHDRSVERTSNGRGLVSTLELTELEGLDWGSWKALRALDAHGEQDPESPDVVEIADRAHLLTLRTLFTLVAQAPRPVQLVVETKHPNRYGGQVERSLVQLLRDFGWSSPAAGSVNPVRVMSFSLLAVRRMRQLAPGLPLVLLMDRVPLPYRDGTLPRGVAAAGISVEILRAHPTYVERVHARGRQVHVWTVDEPDDVQRCLDAGVDAIITNRPRQVLAQVAAAHPA
jgi:glycerophosphoryl diester phosphodiesterase